LRLKRSPAPPRPPPATLPANAENASAAKKGLPGIDEVLLRLFQGRFRTTHVRAKRVACWNWRTIE
jgi:hypothetical protein